MPKRIQTDEKKFKLTVLLPESVVLWVKEQALRADVSQSFFIMALVEEAQAVVAQAAATYKGVAAQVAEHYQGTVKMGEKAAPVAPETLEVIKELEEQAEDKKEAVEIYTELESLPKEEAEKLSPEQLKEAIELYEALQKMPALEHTTEGSTEELLPADGERLGYEGRYTVIDQMKDSVRSGHNLANVHERAAASKYGAEWREVLRRAQRRSEQETDKEENI